MNNPDETLAEQLSALMDGELSEAQARFLLRRLEHDEELRGKWARLQLASSCMKGHALRPMAADLAPRVAAGLAVATPVRAKRPLLQWAIAASVAALALALAPRLMPGNAPESTSAVATTTAAPAEHVLASPASADLVAVHSTPSAGTSPVAADNPSVTASNSDFIKTNPDASAKASPLPLSAQSPTEFPLIDSGDKRSWPRSEVIGGGNDPALEAYLVRHNQMLANDGLGGFVPYVDVVASDPAADSSEPEAPAQDDNQK